jgi:hypothetical protein
MSGAMFLGNFLLFELYMHWHFLSVENVLIYLHGEQGT